MPIGVIVNSLSILFGGIFGAVGGKYMSDDFKTNINMIFGACSMAMGVYAICPNEKSGSRHFCDHYWDRFGTGHSPWKTCQ